MKIKFTKMQGSGNDFIVLDETQQRYNLTCAQYRYLADRHYGIGADQILSVRAASDLDVDFDYVIHNSDGGKVEQCGNGARCFVRFVRTSGLSDKKTIKVRTAERVLTLTENTDGLITVNMGTPIFDATLIPYVTPKPGVIADWDYVLSVGNPHAVCLVREEVNQLEIESRAQKIQANSAFLQGVNVGFMQVIDSANIALRVYERGAGETLACGSGACAAVVAGIMLGQLQSSVHVRVRGGELAISWDKNAPLAPIMLTGDAHIIFHGTIEL